MKKRSVGEIIFDVVDSDNHTEDPGYVALWSWGDTNVITVSEPDETDYPSLAELIEDKNSKLYQ